MSFHSPPPFAMQSVQDFFETSLKSVEGGIPDLPSRVVAVILTGEASASALSEMKSILAEALPAFKTKFKFSIEPRLVGVQGAAHRARQTVTDPFFTKPQEKFSDPQIIEEQNPRIEKKKLHKKL